MSVTKLINYIDQKNIAEELDAVTLTDMGARVKRQYTEDLASMEDWIASVDHGIKLMKPEWAPKSTPWQNASNYKDPILTEASVKFGDKASLELLRGPDLVSASVIGRDPDGTKLAAGERVAEAMNFQINYEMKGWRKNQEKMLYSLPNYGAVFKKVVYDSVDKKSDSVLICYPDFAVNQATSSIESARSFSHILDFSQNDIIERVNAGLWLDIVDEDKDGDEGSNEASGVTNATDNNDRYIEQHCFFDLDDDGYEEPYIITFHESTCKVVRVIARFDTRSVFVDVDGTSVPLDKAMDARKQDIEQSYNVEFSELVGIEIPEDDLSDLTILRVEPFQSIAYYGFIPAPDGTFLNVGYAHLLGALNESINAMTNQLTDSGTLENLSGGLLSKEFRGELGLKRLAPGEWKKTNVPSEKLAKGVFPIPSKAPSQTLYSLSGDKLNRAQSYLAVLDISGQLTAQTSPTTALAMISEAAIPTSAILARILSAEAEEFGILYRINQRTFPADKYQKLLADENADPQMDFSDDLMILPVANAEMSSKTQRLQSAIVCLEQFPLVLQAGGNPVPLLKRFFSAVDADIVEEIFPEEGSMSPQEKQQIEAMTKSQETQNQLQELQLQILAREQDRLDVKTKSEVDKTTSEIEKTKREIAKIESLLGIDQEVEKSKAAKNYADADGQSIENAAARNGV